MASLENIKNIDTILTYILVKKLVTPIVRTDAYKMGLVDVTGKLKKEPSNHLEEKAFTPLDKLVFKLKRLMGSKLLVLNQFLYLQNMNNSMYDKVIVRGNVQQRAEIIRIVKDLEKIQEKYDKDVDDVVYSLLIESLEEYIGEEDGKEEEN